MSISTIPRFLSAGFIVIVCLSCFKFCSAFCCSGVRFEGLVWHRVGKLSASACVTCVIHCLIWILGHCAQHIIHCGFIM